MEEQDEEEEEVEEQDEEEEEVEEQDEEEEEVEEQDEEEEEVEEQDEEEEEEEASLCLERQCIARCAILVSSVLLIATGVTQQPDPCMPVSIAYYAYKP